MPAAGERPESTGVLVVTGFLGSGKTTALNAALRDSAFADSAVIVNEFGEIALDHLLVSDARESVVLTEAGCLCCAALESLPETLIDLFGRRARGETPPFRRVLVETTGLADPAPILRMLIRHPVVNHFAHLQGVVCMLDARLAGETLAREHEAAAQVAQADRVVITKTDLTGGEAPADLLAAVAALNASAEIMLSSAAPREIFAAPASTTPWLGAIRGEDAGQGHDADHHAHAHDAEVRSTSFWIDDEATWPGLASWTRWARERYGADLMRCKGLLRVSGEGGGVVLHGVQGYFDTARIPAWPDLDARSRIVLIGRNLDRDEVAASLSQFKER